MHATSQVLPSFQATLHQTQESFLNGLLHPTSPVPCEVEAEPGLTRQQRFGIYRNAYFARLRGALHSDHPAVCAALRERFESVADQYATSCPSTHSSLRWYGNDFPRFLEGLAHPNAKGLAALAQFERLLLVAFDAADSPRCSPADLEKRAGGAEPLQGLHFHPSAHVFKPGWNVVPQWHAVKRGEALKPWSKDETAWLIWRTADRLTTFQSIELPEQTLFEAISSGASLAEGCEQVLQHSAVEVLPSQVASTLRAWVARGLVAALR